MNFKFVYTKYYDDGSNTSMKWIYGVGERNIIENMFEKIEKILKHEYVELGGIISISNNKIILSYDDFEIIVQPLDFPFDFENYYSEIYDKFEMIKYGVNMEYEI